jgi:MFS family permease
LSWLLPQIKDALLATGLHPDRVDTLVRNEGWRLLMMLGAAPALLTFFIRLFVPESHRWEHEQKRGATSNWAARDLAGVGIGALAACGMIYLWADEFPLSIRIPGSLAALVIVTLGYLYPVWRYLERARAAHGANNTVSPSATYSIGATLRRMLLGACLGGIPLLATWAAIQWASIWGHQIAHGNPYAKGWTQFWSAFGAVIGTVAGAYFADWLGRRAAYCLLCAGSLASVLVFFQTNTAYGGYFLVTVFLAGGMSASFYGWLPLYLPELFPTAVRATGQGFSFNFGRILAAVGALQTGSLIGLLGGSYPQACSIMSLIYVLGFGVIWLAPETRGKPLPE